MKVLKIGIASLDEMRARTIAIARGELKPRRDDSQDMVYLSREHCQSALAIKPILAARNHADASAKSCRTRGENRA